MYVHVPLVWNWTARNITANQVSNIFFDYNILYD